MIYSPEEVFRLVDKYYNIPYSESYGYISQKAAALYYRQYGNDFIHWLEDINDQSACEIILFSLCEHEINYNIMIDKLDREGHYTEENQTLYKDIKLDPKNQLSESCNITEL